MPAILILIAALLAPPLQAECLTDAECLIQCAADPECDGGPQE